MPRTRPTDWRGAQYVRVFRTLPLDRPDVWEDDRALAWWVRLLLLADAAWPLPPALPRDVPDDLADAFVQAEVIDRIGSAAYRFHGLDRLRGRADSVAVAGGRARALGPRGADGRYLPTAGSTPGGPRLDEPGGHPNGNGGPVGWTQPGVGEVSPATLPQPGVPTHKTTQDETTTDPPNVGSSSSLVESRYTRGWTPPADCDDPEAHKASHRRVPGLDVWRCPICEETRREGPSFRDRTGWTPDEEPDDRPW